VLEDAPTVLGHRVLARGILLAEREPRRRVRVAERIMGQYLDEAYPLLDQERQELAREVLPALLLTPAGLAEIDEALRCLSDAELDALLERARPRSEELRRADEPVLGVREKRPPG